MSKPLTSLVAAAALAAQAPHARAQASLPRDSTARVERLAEGVYAIIHDDATDQWPHGNTGVVVSEAGVLVVDATYLPSRARADIALIRRLTDRPIRYLVNTHWHMDHTHGNEAYRDAFPGVTIVTERQTRAFSELNTRYWSRYSTAPDSPRRQGLRELEAELARGTDSTGRAHTAEEKRRLETVIRQRNGELDELANVRVVVADQVFDGATTLWLGGRRVELVDHGRANSPHDVTVYLPKERILFAGDILVQCARPGELAAQGLGLGRPYPTPACRGRSPGSTCWPTLRSSPSPPWCRAMGRSCAITPTPDRCGSCSWR